MESGSAREFNVELDVVKCTEIYNSIILHPDIRRVSEKYFKERDYRHAVFDAYVTLEEMIKKKTNYPKKRGTELIGVSLMHVVFDEHNPLLSWSPLVSQTEKDEQKGFQFIFAGAMQGIKNPKSHSIEQPELYRALNDLILANYLAYLVEVAEYNPSTNLLTEKKSEKVSKLSPKDNEKSTNVLRLIIEEFKKKKIKLIGLFASGGIDYLHRQSTVGTWELSKSELNEFYPDLISDFIEIYDSLEQLNEIIKSSVGTVDYSDPKFIPHKQLAARTEGKIHTLLEKIQNEYDIK